MRTLRKLVIFQQLEREKNMYKVLIVDDEILIRKGIGSTIDWESIGFSIVADASNGREALELIEIHRPHVVLTDIKMPEMDGLKLTEEIKKTDPRTKVLILSSHNGFSYVRQALKLGATDYILKTEIEVERLTDTMLRVRRELEREGMEAEKLMNMERQLTLNTNHLKEKLLNDLIEYNYIDNNDFISRCRSLGYKVQDMDLLLVMMRLAGIGENSSFCEGDRNLIGFSIKNIISEILGEAGYGCLFLRKEDSMVALAFKERIDEQQLENAVKKIREHILEYLNLRTNIMLSKKYRDPLATRDVYLKCSEDFQVFFYEKNGLVSCGRNLNFADFNVLSLREIYLRQLIDSIDRKDSRKAVNAILGLDMFFRERCAPPLKAKMVYTGFIFYILEYYRTYLQNGNELYNYARSYEFIYNTEKLSDITSYMKMFLNNIINEIGDCSKNYIISEAENYIKQNYQKDIGLQAVATYLNISKHYLSYLFKKETGENVSHYINRIRIENAKTILKKPKYRSKDVYDMVGFSNQQYFCKTFKKVSGMTVTQYIERVAWGARKG